MRYEGVYHEVEWNSEPKQQELDTTSREGTEIFFSLKYIGKINYSKSHTKFEKRLKFLCRNNSPSYRNLKEQNNISEIEMKRGKYIFHHKILV